MTTTALIAHQTITAIVDNVTQARADVQQAFALLQGAKERLAAVLGKDNIYNHLWERNPADYDLPREAERSDLYIARHAWEYVISQTGLRHFMTERRSKELQEQLIKGAFPAFTVENVLSTLQG